MPKNKESHHNQDSFTKEQDLEFFYQFYFVLFGFGSITWSFFSVYVLTLFFIPKLSWWTIIITDFIQFIILMTISATTCAILACSFGEDDDKKIVAYNKMEFKYQRVLFVISITNWLLGKVAYVSIWYWMIYPINCWTPLSIFQLLHVAYYNLEFFFNCMFNFKDMNYDCFHIYNSWHCAIGHIFPILEFYWRTSLLNYLGFGHIDLFVYLGAPVALFGIFMRIGAYLSLLENYTHNVPYRKKKDMELTTDGLYAQERHPGYLGTFLFMVSNQVILSNHISFVFYNGVLYHYFLNRLKDEEEMLIRFYGNAYIKYRQEVKTRLPYGIDQKVKKFTDVLD